MCWAQNEETNYVNFLIFWLLTSDRSTRTGIAHAPCAYTCTCAQHEPSMRTPSTAHARCASSVGKSRSRYPFMCSRCHNFKMARTWKLSRLHLYISFSLFVIFMLGVRSSNKFDSCRLVYICRSLDQDLQQANFLLGCICKIVIGFGKGKNESIFMYSNCSLSSPIHNLRLN